MSLLCITLVLVGSLNFNITLSTIGSGSEYIITTEAIKKALWVRGLLNELVVLSNNVIVYSDV